MPACAGLALGALPPSAAENHQRSVSTDLKSLQSARNDARLLQIMLQRTVSTWKAAPPIAIVESAARAREINGVTYPYLLFRNTGTFPIRITGIIGGDGGKATQIYNNCEASGAVNMSDYFYLAPGEEKYIAYGGGYGLPCSRYVYSYVGGTSSSYYVRGASSVCQNSSVSPGTLSYKTFGFEYIAYINGQQITKRQIGKELIIKCREPY